MRAAAIQLTTSEDNARNMTRADRLVRRAAELGAELVVMPEKWVGLGDVGHMRAAAQPLEGDAVAWARGIARELGIDLVAGSIVEAASASPATADDRFFNTSVHAGPDGEVHAVYRKLHLFDADVGGRAYQESAATAPGDEIVVSRTADGAGLGLAVCYDLRFPELFRALAERGARILTLPSAFTLATTRDHWEPLLRARAIENQAFVIAANQVGTHADGTQSGGRSMIVDPWGVVLAQAPDEEAVIVAELDFDHQDAVRARLPALGHRRPDVWSAGSAVAADVRSRS